MKVKYGMPHLESLKETRNEWKDNIKIDFKKIFKVTF
jgi:hypothetical protein